MLALALDIAFFVQSDYSSMQCLIDWKTVYGRMFNILYFSLPTSYLLTKLYGPIKPLCSCLGEIVDLLKY